MDYPEGFEPHFRKSNFTAPWEPLYSKIEDSQIRLGVELREAHCNSRSLVHGAFLTALADNAIGLSLGLELEKQDRVASGLVTVNLSIDYVGMATVGQWISTDTEVIKIGGSMGFAASIISNSDGPIARVNATFKILNPKG